MDPKYFWVKLHWLSTVPDHIHTETNQSIQVGNILKVSTKLIQTH